MSPLGYNPMALQGQLQNPDSPCSGLAYNPLILQCGGMPASIFPSSAQPGFALQQPRTLAREARDCAHLCAGHLPNINLVISEAATTAPNSPTTSPASDGSSVSTVFFLF